MTPNYSSYFEQRKKEGWKDTPIVSAKDTQDTMDTPSTTPSVDQNKQQGVLESAGNFVGGVFTSLAKRTGNLATIKKEATPMRALSTPLRAVGEAAGFVGDVAGEAAKSVFHLLPTEAQEKAKAGVGGTMEALGIPQGMAKYQTWAEKHQEAAKDIEASMNIASMFPIGKGASLVKGAGASALEKTGAKEALNVAKTKTLSAVSHLGKPIEENVKTALTDTARSADIESTLVKYFDAAKTAKSNTKAMTPIEIAGREKLGEALTTLQSKLKTIGKSKETALSQKAKEVVPVKEAYDKFGEKLDSILGTNISPEGELVHATGRVSQVIDSPSDEALVKLVHNSIGTLKRNPTVQEVNDIVDKLQSKLYSSKQVGAIPINKKTESIVKGFISDLDKSTKTVAGEAYTQSNVDYSRIIKLRDELNKTLGVNSKNAGSFLKQVFSPAGGKAKRLISEIEAETGLPIFEHATLAKYAMDSVNDPRIKSLLEQGLAAGSSRGIAEKILGFIQEKLSTPEAMESRAKELIRSTKK